jgi:hypothetical protein
MLSATFTSLAQFQLPAEDGQQRGTCHILVAKHASEKRLSQYLAPNDYQVGILWIAGATDLVVCSQRDRNPRRMVSRHLRLMAIKAAIVGD